MRPYCCCTVGAACGIEAASVRLGELQRVERIDQAGAEIVVALARPKPLCTRGQNAADVGGRELGVALEQHATMPLTAAAATEVPVVSW